MQEKFETKHVKHTFTVEERNTLGAELARALAHSRGLIAEFDSVKSSYKAQTAEAESKVMNISTAIMNGFEMRNKRCRVVFRPADKKKDFYPEDAKPDDLPVLTEEMTKDDFQAELIQAESKFEKKQEITLFDAGDDRGILVVGQLGNKWFSALRMKVGRCMLEQRLDSEQKAFKQRNDAITVASKAAMTWLTESLGKDTAAGFQDRIAAAIDPQMDRVE